MKQFLLIKLNNENEDITNLMHHLEHIQACNFFYFRKVYLKYFYIFQFPVINYTLYLGWSSIGALWIYKNYFKNTWIF